MERLKLQWNEQIEGIEAQFEELRNQIRLQEQQTEKFKDEFVILEGAVDLVAKRNHKKLKDLTDRLSEVNLNEEHKEEQEKERPSSGVRPMPRPSTKSPIPKNQSISPTSGLNRNGSGTSCRRALKKVAAPPHTPNVARFVHRPDGFPPHKVNECELFMVRYSASDRARLIAKQSRCFRCWELGWFDEDNAHVSGHCDHVRYCGKCMSGSHHAALCGALLVTKKKQLV